MSHLHIDHLMVSYNNSYSLTSDCTLTTGMIWQVVGANASGKTTLLSQLLFGQAKKSSSISIGDTPASQKAVGALDYRGLYTEWTVKQNLRYFLDRKSLNPQRIYLNTLVEPSWYSRRTYQLSSAQKKKLLIGILLEQEARVLVLDELDDAFDSKSLSQVLDAISLWLAHDGDRIAIVACKTPLPTIKNRLQIVPVNNDQGYFVARVHNEIDNEESS